MMFFHKFWALFACSVLLAACSTDYGNVVLGPDQVMAEKGDTVYSIAKQYKISVRELIRQNRLSAPYSLKEGQILVLPDRLDGQSFSENDGMLDNESAEVLDRKISKGMGPSLLDEDLVEPAQTTAQVVEQVKTVPFMNQDAYSLASKKRESIRKESVAASVAASKVPASKNKRLIEEACLDFESSETKQKKVDKTKSSVAKDTFKQDSFAWPLRGDVVTRYGETLEDGKKCHGIRIKSLGNKTISAAAMGTVIFAGNELSGKNIVIIKHPNGWLTAYAPLSRVSVKPQQIVQANQKVGFLLGDELHFEVRKDRTQHINPLPYLK